MRLLPRSLGGRLAVTAVAAIAAALLLSGFTIGHILGRFVMHGLDERLDAQIAVVSRAVRPDGTLDPGLAIDVPPFDQPGSGWGWEIVGPRGRLASASLRGSALPTPDRIGPPPPRHDRDDRRDHIRPLDGEDGVGRAIHYRVLTVPTAAGEVAVIAAGPRWIVDRPLHAAMAPLLLSLLLLCLLLAIALLVQLRIGLRPLKRLEAMVAAARAGEVRHLDVAEPTEILPLVAELNALIDANEQTVERARGHVANLAHGLKTPLAALRLDLAEPGVDPEGRLAAQVVRMEAHIRHHLGRARAGQAGNTARVTVALAPHVGDLVAALTRIHADRGVACSVDIADDLTVRCDPQDLDELLGNLLDNAWRWARSTVAVSALAEGPTVRIVIADDGPGISADRAAASRRPLDEREQGHGFGLAISRELAELHGGTLTLGRSTLGGLEVVLGLRSGRGRS